MLMVQSLRSLLAAVMAPLVLAGCTGTSRPGGRARTASGQQRAAERHERGRERLEQLPSVALRSA